MGNVQFHVDFKNKNRTQKNQDTPQRNLYYMERDISREPTRCALIQLLVIWQIQTNTNCRKSLPVATWLNYVLKGTKPRIEPHLPTTSAENLEVGGQVQCDSPKPTSIQTLKPLRMEAQTTKIYYPEVSIYLMLFQPTF